MLRPAIFISVIGGVVLCLLGMSSKLPGGQGPDSADITVFLTGNLLGELKPCGCFGGQLGGLDKRKPILDCVPESRRMIIDTGMFVATNNEQDLIKFNIAVQSIGLLGYDVVNLTEKDVRICKDLGLLESINSIFNVISASEPVETDLPVKFTKEFKVRDKDLAVTVISFDCDQPVEKVVEIFSGSKADENINILILSKFDSDFIDSIKKTGIVSCIICPAEYDEAAMISKQGERPLVISLGQYGRYVSKLGIKVGKKSKRISVDYTVVAVTEDLISDKALMELYKDYQHLVKEAGLLEKHPRVPLPSGLKYVGSEKCQSCHQYEYEKWSTKAHAHAYKTLEEVGSQFDPECVICHVIGMNYESGFISVEKTGHLKDVGCEQCHGAGSEHIETAGAVTPGTEVRSGCIDCHTPEHSAYFAGKEEEYKKKIIHWKEQKTADNVKK